jgi:hypothetical protein
MMTANTTPIVVTEAPFVPSAELVICGKAIRIARAGLIRVASLRDELCDEGVDDPEEMIRQLKQQAKADIFNFRQQLPCTDRLFPYPSEVDNLAVLDITSYDHWWNTEIRNDARRMVRKASKAGVDIREVPFDDELVAGIKGIWDESRFRQGRPYYHYNKPFNAVKRENSTFMERSQFIGAFYKGELIGFNKVFYTGCRADHIEIISKIAHRDKSPTNALLAKSIELAAARGTPHMTYAKFTYGKKGDDSLTDFKQRNGFRMVEIPRYFVPLTSAGSLALKMGLHKGFKEALPASVLRGVSKARTAWGKATVKFLNKPKAAAVEE